MAYNPVYHTVVSADDRGMVEYWSPEDFELPEQAVKFRYKAETSLYEFCKKKTKPHSLAFSADGSQFVCMGEDKNVRVFKFQTGKLRMQYDEGAAIAQEMQQKGDPRYHLDPMEFGRRMAVEHALDQPSNAVFDESGHFLIYSTMLGIKIVNTHTHQVARLLGKVESGARGGLRARLANRLRQERGYVRRQPDVSRGREGSTDGGREHQSPLGHGQSRCRLKLIRLGLGLGLGLRGRGCAGDGCDAALSADRRRPACTSRQYPRPASRGGRGQRQR